jgi:energy-converting hydrogenase Eha subunit C
MKRSCTGRFLRVPGINLINITSCLFLASIGSLSHYHTQFINKIQIFSLAASGIIFLIKVLAPSKLSPNLVLNDWVLIWGAIATILKWATAGSITIRLLIFQRSLLRSLGESLQSNHLCLGVVLIKSTALLSTFTIFFMSAYYVRSPSLVMIPFLLTQVQVSN